MLAISWIAAGLRFHLAPLAGRGRIRAIARIRVRGTLHESRSLREPLTLTLSPRKSGERGKSQRYSDQLERISLWNVKAARDRRPGGLAVIVPTQKFGSLPRASLILPEIRYRQAYDR